MKYTEYQYQRPPINDYVHLLENYTSALGEKQSAEEQLEIFKQVAAIDTEFSTAVNYVTTRVRGNTADEFYRAEQNYIDEKSPDYIEALNKFHHDLAKSTQRQALEKELGQHLFKLIDCDLRSFSPEVKKEITAQQQLATDYMALKAKAQIDFDGQKLSLTQITPYTHSTDPKVRRRATDAIFEFYAENEAEFDRIYDEMVKLRHTQAIKLGYENYVQCAYDILRRTDYNAQDVANYRRQVLENVVPLAQDLFERQRLRLGLDKLTYYDEDIIFPDGNATPKGDPEWIIERAREMYTELSPETKEFIEGMIEGEYLDLVARKDKAGGGFCIGLDKLGMPFIFSNFNGAQHDVEVLTHEAGHAFQNYLCNKFLVPDYRFPTYEACEIHSMSMEFITWPWMQNFFEEDIDKFKYAHLAHSICFLPYGVAVDEFQEWVYLHPEATPDERKQQWRAIEKIYLPHRDYAGIDYLERGNFWVRQQHIFIHPFYYIDYTLAQVCAFQYFNKSQADPKQCWQEYLDLCKLGGKYPFTELLKKAGLMNPFVDGTVKTSIAPAYELLKQSQYYIG